uniref:Major facilitator superfamily (MFS) profile domain-containing protein n=1 Tax=Chromera velia CCMP2878 TaxID=1169474 RepID=A0A0G4I889_9ALVE|eukprot:Cvel_1977.t1-p1 / transcript=Cvel_1977.t1 / gene=Cvel_1977 / organism=Chromera_velia_CCMP2878 / gene_product=MFS-type transporter SLC18B1, putative / transcript_product=MFS-type transporter SLC18B1, putative / location=Cvel_scaffold75:47394-48995(-) / protein_length=534 / sequence_SO=supercontig / SO=protein_coding / is_pseudo=false
MDEGKLLSESGGETGKMGEGTTGASNLPPVAWVSASQAAKVMNFAMVFCLALMALVITPFFSTVAHYKLYLRESAVGVIFGSWAVGYICCSIALSLTNFSRLSLRSINLILRAALIFIGCVMLMFGFLPSMIPPSRSLESEIRLTVAFSALRFSFGVACAIFDVSILTFLVACFPHEVSEVVGLWETSAALGALCGPPIGGVLYDVGGFSLPFVVTTGVATVLAVGTAIVQEKSRTLRALFAQRVAEQRRREEEEKGKGEKKVAVSFTLKHTKALLLTFPAYQMCGSAVALWMGVSLFTFMEALMPIWYDSMYSLSATDVGALIALMAVSFGIVNVVVGKALDVFPLGRPYVILLSLFGLGVSAFFLCPSFDLSTAFSFSSSRPSIVLNQPLHTQTLLTVAVIAAVGFAVFYSGILVGSQSLSVDAARRRDPDLVPATGALMKTMSSLAGLVGPVAGSELVQSFGYPRTLFFWGCASLGMGVVFWLMFVCRPPGSEGVFLKRGERNVQEEEEGEGEGVDEKGKLREEKTSGTGI